MLLEAARQSNNSYGNLIVMAEHTVGRGRVLYVGTDTLWKWQTLGPENKAGATPYSIFWQQAFRALTPERPPAGGTQLWLQPERSRGEVGKPIPLQAELRSDRPLTALRVEAAVVLPDERRLPLAFAADPADPRSSVPSSRPPLPGRTALSHRSSPPVASRRKRRRCSTWTPRAARMRMPASIAPTWNASPPLPEAG